MKKIANLLFCAFLVATSLASCKKEESSRNINGHEYVDLGLSVKWATCNVGAETPDEYGDYYYWGATEPWDYGDPAEEITEISGNPEYDAARANWGGSWRLPTLEEIYELTDNCSWELTEQNGHNGMRVTGPNGNSIFLPAGGGSYEVDYGIVIGEVGLYWSSTPDEEYWRDIAAYYLTFYIDDEPRYVISESRAVGLSVRPVTD